MLQCSMPSATFSEPTPFSFLPETSRFSGGLIRSGFCRDYVLESSTSRRGL